MATSTALIDWLYKALNVKYHKKVKRLGRPTHCLGWKTTFEAPGSIHLSQPHYIQKALRMMRLEDANGRDTPHAEGYRYHGPDTDDITIPQQKAKYQETLGELRYIADCTRPYITFFVNHISCAAHKPTKRHWAIMKNLLKYLKAAREEGIRFYPFSAVPSLTAFIRDTNIPAHPLHSYADADFAGETLDRKSISGAVHLFNASPITWTSTKQKIQALSTCEAEYVSATAAVQTTQWLRRVLRFLGLQQSTPTLSSSIKLQSPLPRTLLQRKSESLSTFVGTTYANTSV